MVTGDYFGVTPDGAAGFGNSADGLVLDGSSNDTVTGNVAGDNGQDGIHLLGGATGNVVQGNWVGTTPAGGAAGNGAAGVSWPTRRTTRSAAPRPGRATPSPTTAGRASP